MTNDLLSALREQTAIASSPDQMREAPAFKRIIAHGRAALPSLCDALERDDDLAMPIMVLLGDITGDNPIGREDQGNVSRMRAAWLDWADMNGLSASSE